MSVFFVFFFVSLPDFGRGWEKLPLSYSLPGAGTGGFGPTAGFGLV
jgi:hypothetical protein